MLKLPSYVYLFLGLSAGGFLAQICSLWGVSTCRIAIDAIPECHLVSPLQGRHVVWADTYSRHAGNGDGWK